jgi:hypothetical protein
MGTVSSIGLSLDQPAIRCAGRRAAHPHSAPVAGSTACRCDSWFSHVMPGQFVDGRIAFLKAPLKITPAREAQWQRVQAAMRENAKTLDQTITDHRQDGVNKFTLKKLLTPAAGLRGPVTAADASALAQTAPAPANYPAAPSEACHHARWRGCTFSIRRAADAGYSNVPTTSLPSPRSALSIRMPVWSSCTGIRSRSCCRSRG